MVHRIALFAALGLFALAAPAQAQLDLTPVEQKVLFEGVPYAQTGFRNGSGPIVTYQAPGGWKLQGGGTRLEMRPETLTLAIASIETRPLPPDRALDGATVEKLQAEVTKALPREAEGVKWEEVEANPVLLNRHETRRLTVSYAAFAQRFTTTVVVCNFAKEQVIFRLDCRTDDFLPQYDLFRRSLYTWQGLP